MQRLLSRNRVDRAALARVETPPATATWCPVPHAEFVERVDSSLGAAGIHVRKEQHALDHDGARYFGLFELEPLEDGIAHAFGLRNSHDQKFPLGIASGMLVFVCSNLSFVGDMVVVRDHTPGIRDDLDDLIAHAIRGIGGHRARMREQIDRFRETRLSAVVLREILLRSLDAGIIPASQTAALTRYLTGDGWSKEQEAAFAGPTVWRLLNAYTSVLKDSDVFDLVERTQSLHALLEDHCVGPVRRKRVSEAV